MLKNTLCFVVTVGVLSFVAPSSEAKKKFRFGVEDIPYLPYYETQNNNFRGFARDYFEAFGRDADYEIEFVPLPVKRLYKDFVSGRVDFKFPDNEKWGGDSKKGKNITYSKNVVGFTDCVMVQPSKSKMAKEKLKVLGTVRGFTPWLFLGDVKGGKMKLVENNSLAGLLKLGMLGRVDGVYVNLEVAKYLLNNTLNKPGQLVFNKSIPHTQDHYKLSTIKHPDVLKKLNVWLSKNKKLKEKLKKKWQLSE